MLDRLLSPDPPPFALLHRPGSGVADIDVIVGDISACERIADIPLSPEGPRARDARPAALPPDQGSAATPAPTTRPRCWR